MRILLALGFVILSATLASADDKWIWMENTTVDGMAVRMVFDTGSSSVCLTSQAVERLGLKIIVPPTNGFGKTAVCTLDISGTSFRTNFEVIRFYPMIPNFDGLMGWDSICSNIFRIDTEAQKLTFLPEVPAGIKPWTQLLIDPNSGTLELQIPGIRNGRNLISVDTGASCGVALTTREWKRWKKTHPHSPITLRGYSTVDGLYAEEESWADQIQIGPLTLYDVPVVHESRSTAIQLGSERDVLGFAALCRLDLVVDGIHGVAYLRAKQTPPVPYSYNRLGAEFIPTARDANDLVAHVVTGSPAYIAGIRNGDVLLKVDGDSVSGWTNGWMESGPDTLSMPAGTRVELTLRRKQKIFETSATLREILQPSHRTYAAEDDSAGLSEMDAESYCAQGIQRERQGDANGALTNFDKAIETDPNLGDAYRGRANLEQSSSNMDAALADYNKAIDLGNSAAEDYGNRGTVEKSKGNSAAALADYTKAIELEPDLTLFYAGRGSVEQQENELDPAIADYEKALQLKAPLPGIKSNLAYLYACRGWSEQGTNEYDAAIADYEKAIQLEPDLNDTKTNLASLYDYRGQTEFNTNNMKAALSDLTKEIALGPGSLQTYEDHGWLEQEQGNLSGALADYDQAIALQPTCAWAYEVRGQVEQQQGNFEAAEADTVMSGQLDSSLATNAAWELSYLGDLRYERQEFTNALSDFEKACKLTPLDDYGHLDIWLCHSRLGEIQTANTELRAYLGSVRVENTNGWSLENVRFLIGQVIEADYFNAAKADGDEKNGRYCEAYFYAGSKHLIAGDTAAAAAYFEKCVSTTATNFTEYEFARADLRMLKTNGVSP